MDTIFILISHRIRNLTLKDFVLSIIFTLWFSGLFYISPTRTALSATTICMSFAFPGLIPLCMVPISFVISAITNPSSFYSVIGIVQIIGCSSIPAIFKFWYDGHLSSVFAYFYPKPPVISPEVLLKMAKEVEWTSEALAVGILPGMEKLRLEIMYSKLQIANLRHEIHNDNLDLILALKEDLTKKISTLETLITEAKRVYPIVSETDSDGEKELLQSSLKDVLNDRQQLEAVPDQTLIENNGENAAALTREKFQRDMNNRTIMDEFYERKESICEDIKITQHLQEAYVQTKEVIIPPTPDPLQDRIFWGLTKMTGTVVMVEVLRNIGNVYLVKNGYTGIPFDFTKYVGFSAGCLSSQIKIQDFNKDKMIILPTKISNPLPEEKSSVLFDFMKDLLKVDKETKNTIMEQAALPMIEESKQKEQISNKPALVKAHSFMREPLPFYTEAAVPQIQKATVIKPVEVISHSNNTSASIERIKDIRSAYESIL